MTFTRFIVKNTFRNKRRVSLTILSIGFSLFLLVMLRTFMHTLLEPPQTESGTLRLVVRGSTTAFADSLPISHVEKIRKMPHIAHVLPMQWFGGYYKEPKNFFPNFATDPDELWNTFPDFIASDETKAAFKAEKIAAVAQEQLMEVYGFKVGDRLTLISTQFLVNLEVRIVGTFQYPENQRLFYFRYDYLDEARGNPGTVGMIFLSADAPENIPGIIETVDGAFRNSSAETKTETEKAFRLGFVSMLGNVRLLIGSIAGVVVFTMLLVTASTMASTIRERLREVAILKSLGYPGRTVLMLMLGEAALISILGGLTGCAFAWILANTDLAGYTRGFIRQFTVRPVTYANAVGMGAVIGILSGFLPALQASRMTITEAMRRLD